MLCYKDVDNVLYENGDDKLDTKTAVNASLGKVNGTQFADNCYWSSSEYAGDGSVAFYVRFDNANVYGGSKGDRTYYVRAVCAY